MVAEAPDGELDGGAAPSRPTERPAEFSDESRGLRWQYHCLSDSECTERDYGQCRLTFGGLGDLRIYQCEYGCATDADCADGNACRCAEHGGHCVNAECRTSDDCGSGKCAAYQDNICSTIHGFACTDFRGQCYQDADCADQGQCYYNPDDGYRICSGAVCGRPFLVEQASVLAEAVARADWAGNDRGVRPHPLVDDAVRLDLAKAWTQIGLMEHASIAAFARFSMQLLSLGAPAQLLEASARAMADELNHVQLAFTGSTRFSGEAVGPDLRMDVLAGVVLPCMRELCAMLPRNDVVRWDAPSSVRSGVCHGVRVHWLLGARS